MKVIAGIATYNNRVSIERTLDSIVNQFDEINVYDNEIEEVNLTDNGKFQSLKDYSEPIYFFSLDDDLIYPPDYVNRTLEAIEKHKSIVTYHGRRLKGLNRSYYRGHSAFSCLRSFVQTTPIDVPGTGCTAFRTDYFNPTEIYRSEDKRMSDLVFALEAAKQGKRIMHIGHQGDWIKYIEQPKGTTIYEMESGNAIRQQQIANEIWRLKYNH